MNTVKNLHNPKTSSIFIVEDNAVYAKLLDEFLRTRIPGINQIKIFPTGEECLMELYQNPAFIIMDHLLNTNYADAATGLSIMKKIKTSSPETNVILLTSQREFDVVSKTISKYGCTYIQKDEQAFKKVGQLIRGIFQG
jgi:response regulator of citrate/malate metabolism